MKGKEKSLKRPVFNCDFSETHGYIGSMIIELGGINELQILSSFVSRNNDYKKYINVSIKLRCVYLQQQQNCITKLFTMSADNENINGIVVITNNQ